MYTHFYWFFDKNDKLYYKNFFRASSVADAYIRQGRLLENDKRVSGHAEDAVKVYTVTVLTSRLNLSPDAMLADTIFCLACSHLELTSAETNVMLLVRTRKSYQELADDANTSVHTIRKHLSNAFTKLDVKDQGEALHKIEKHAARLDGSE